MGLEGDFRRVGGSSPTDELLTQILHWLTE